MTFADLVAALHDAGARITFSRHCCSGIISVLPGEQCQCWRCRRERGEPVTRASEAKAAILSRRAQKEFRKLVLS